MLRCFFVATFLLLFLATVSAQDFITRGKIEYEVKQNNKRMYEDEGDEDWADNMPAYDISYRELIFSWNRMIYIPGKKSLTSPDDKNENITYTDLDKSEVIRKRKQLDEYYIYADSTKKIRWKIQGETRKIAGWECRKAVGRIYDSIYVVAFYCPEIIPQGGPGLFTGLPGMILGLAIPRYFTTWFAKKIEIANIDEDKIAPPVLKKARQYSKKELAQLLYKKWKETGWWKEVTPEAIERNLGNYID